MINSLVNSLYKVCHKVVFADIMSVNSSTVITCAMSSSGIYYNSDETMRKCKRDTILCLPSKYIFKPRRICCTEN